MNIAQMKEIEDLKEGLSERRKYRTSLYSNNISPLVKQYENDFMEKAKGYFKSQSFEVDESGGRSSFSATYKSLVFRVTKDSGVILVQRGNDLLARVGIGYKKYVGGASSIPSDEFSAEKTKIKHESDGIEKDIECFSNPEVYYQYSGRRFNDPIDLLNEIVK